MVEAGRKNLTPVHVENGSLELRVRTDAMASDGIKTHDVEACEIGEN
jgi:hypothetical protein